MFKSFKAIIGTVRRQKCEKKFIIFPTLRGETEYFLDCKRMPKQGRSFFLLVFSPWLFRQSFILLKELSLESRNIEIQCYAPIQFLVWPRNVLLFLRRWFFVLQT